MGDNAKWLRDVGEWVAPDNGSNYEEFPLGLLFTYRGYVAGDGDIVRRSNCPKIESSGCAPSRINSRVDPLARVKIILPL